MNFLARHFDLLTIWFVSYTIASQTWDDIQQYLVTYPVLQVWKLSDQFESLRIRYSKNFVYFRYAKGRISRLLMFGREWVYLLIGF